MDFNRGNRIGRSARNRSIAAQPLILFARPSRLLSYVPQRNRRKYPSTNAAGAAALDGCRRSDVKRIVFEHHVERILEGPIALPQAVLDEKQLECIALPGLPV